jgi:hypothetical protein
MQPITVDFQLSEALEDLQALVTKLRTGEIHADDDPELAVRLGHILDHISRAWNCKDMPPEEKSKLTQEEFERLSNTVPNFCGGRVLGDVAVS